MNFFQIIKNEKSIISFIFGGLLFILPTIIFFFWNDTSFNSEQTIDSEKFGQFGDFIGGVIGSIWALAGVLLFYKALTDQREDFKNNKKALDLQTKALKQQIEEFKLQSNELKASRNIYEEQSKTLRLQQFESSFYSLLNVYLTIKENLNKVDSNKDYFKTLYGKFDLPYNIKIDIIDYNSKMVDQYMTIFNDDRGYLSHYFKLFYRLIKMIDLNTNLTNEEKKLYSKILRAQITDYENIILFYNSQSIYGEKSRTLILKHNFLKHVPIFQKPEFKFFLHEQKNHEIIEFAEIFNAFVTKQIKGTSKNYP